MNQGILPGATPCVTPNLQRFLTRLDRPALEAVAQAAIDQLDVIDGDADIEDDDPAGQADEDGVNTGSGILCLHGIHQDGPGCPISDTGVGDHDDDGIGCCGEYGIDQSRSTAPVLGFVSLNDMSPADIAISATPLRRRRLDGTLRLRVGGRP